MAECKYYSFYALAKINDPELLYEAFQQQIAPGYADKIEIEVFEHSDRHWNRLTRSGGLGGPWRSDGLDVDDRRLEHLERHVHRRMLERGLPQLAFLLASGRVRARLARAGVRRGDPR